MAPKKIISCIVFNFISTKLKSDSIIPFILIVRVEDPFMSVFSEIFYAPIDTLKI